MSGFGREITSQVQMSGLEEHPMRVLDICIITTLALVNHHAVCHCIDIGCASLQQSSINPYRLNPLQLEFMRQGLQYIFVNNIIKLTYNKWCFPCILVHVHTTDDTFYFVFDIRQVNSVRKYDSNHIQRIDHCSDETGHAQYVRKFDLLKDYLLTGTIDR